MPRDSEFAGRVVFVTGGAGAGIGSAACRRFAQLGAAVAVVDEHGPRATRIADELHREFDVAVCAVAVDVADRADVDVALPTGRPQLRPGHILVNNPALNTQGAIFDYDPDRFD